MRKALGSGTKFGAFLHATSQVVRAGRPVSAKAIFPLPVPVPGVFGVQGGRLSSQKRRKRHFEQAFHIVVMALNYLHADFQFVDLKLLARPPNAAQVEALQNLRRILLAFGHSAGEISVPASGRRCTSLVSLLADLSEFLTQEGVVDSAYHRGFPGVEKEGILPKKKSSLDKEEKGQTSSVVREGAVVPQDVEKAPELIPYRDLEPSRLVPCSLPRWSALDGFPGTYVSSMDFGFHSSWSPWSWPRRPWQDTPIGKGLGHQWFASSGPTCFRREHGAIMPEGFQLPEV